tara:strand:+ start:165 stop:806 length:642 start_codon:yes stop_codon:yes gene_type:complete
MAITDFSRGWVNQGENQMANSLKQVTIKGSKFNLGDIEKAAIAGVEQGSNDFDGVGSLNQVIIHQDFAVVSGSQVTDNAFSGNAGTLTEAAHAGKLVYMPDVNANATLRIPTPSKAGITYRLIANNVADDAHNVVISFPDDECYFQGAVISLDEDQAGAAQTSTIYANGSSNDVLTLTGAHFYDLTMTSLSTSVMLVSGITISDDHAAFSDAD